jgi:hypothetical protein
LRSRQIGQRKENSGFQQLGARHFEARSNGARVRSRIVAQYAADGVEAGGAGDQMHSNPKFWALTAGLFILLYLAAINIIVKINMFLHLMDNG